MEFKLISIIFHRYLPS